MATDNSTTATTLVPHRKASDEEVSQAMTTGIVFKGSKMRGPAPAAGVKTKAKKKGYVTGAHGSGAARKRLISEHGGPTGIRNSILSNGEKQLD